jgi:uncharacterized membrane protein
VSKDPKTWLDSQTVWAALVAAVLLIAQAATAQAKLAEHDRQLEDLKDVVPAIRALQVEISNLRGDVRDLRTSKKD